MQFQQQSCVFSFLGSISAAPFPQALRVGDEQQKAATLASSRSFSRQSVLMRIPHKRIRWDPPSQRLCHLLEQRGHGGRSRWKPRNGSCRNSFMKASVLSLTSISTWTASTRGGWFNWCTGELLVLIPAPGYHHCHTLAQKPSSHVYVTKTPETQFHMCVSLLSFVSLTQTT